MKAAPTVQPLLTFGQCLKNILGARKLSASALSRMMEQKSRNSMFRILDDTGGPAVQAAGLRLSREQLRAAVVMSEILAKPVALRGRKRVY